MQVKRIAECPPWSILQYFRPSLSYHLSLRSLFFSIFEWPLKTGFTVVLYYSLVTGRRDTVWWAVLSGSGLSTTRDTSWTVLSRMCNSSWHSQSVCTWWYNKTGELKTILYSQYRGSYMGAHVLLNLWDELGKRGKMRGLLKKQLILLFCSKFNEFNNTRVHMLDSIYHMALKLLWNHIFGMKMLEFCHYACNAVMDVMTKHADLISSYLIYQVAYLMSECFIRLLAWYQTAYFISECCLNTRTLAWYQPVYLILDYLPDIRLLTLHQNAYLISACLLDTRRLTWFQNALDISLITWYQNAYLVSACLLDIRMLTWYWSAYLMSGF